MRSSIGYLSRNCSNCVLCKSSGLCIWDGDATKPQVGVVQVKIAIAESTVRIHVTDGVWKHIIRFSDALRVPNCVFFPCGEIRPVRLDGAEILPPSPRLC